MKFYHYIVPSDMEKHGKSFLLKSLLRQDIQVFLIALDLSQREVRGIFMR
jgi:hypothetical protein